MSIIDWYVFGLLGTGIVYLVGMLWLIVGLNRQNRVVSTRLPHVSVIVAARNEVQSLGACLQALQAQEYLGEWDVVVVDDRSDDGTRGILENMAKDWPRLKALYLSTSGEFKCPKKNALAAAISASNGEILLFTDADCQPLSGWIASTVEAFDEEVGLVAGFARAVGARGLRQYVLALDNLAVAALAAGSMSLQAPLACTGRNLAYRRQVYDELGGFTSIGHLLGGDDVYFMRLVATSSWQMVYNRAKENIVISDSGPVTWGATLQQKLRHAGKAGNYSGPALWLAGAVYVFHVLLLIGLGQGVLGHGWLPWFWIIWGLRCWVDAIFLWFFAPEPVDRNLLFFLPALEVCYIPYVVFFTVLGRFGWFRWKR